MAAEELVERVFARHVEGQPGVTPARASPHLTQRGDGAREGHADGGVEIAHVDAQLKGVGGHHRQQIALGQAPLDLTTLRGGVARAVGRDPGGQVGPAGVLQAQPREALDQLDSAP